MSRDTKFKAWNIEEKIMHDAAWPSWNGCIEVWANNVPQSKVQFLSMHGPADEGILLEYTGLKDKNGVDIYEGDIVEYNPDGWGKKRQTISWYRSGFHFPKATEPGLGGLPGDRPTVTVIGNIHENPELLFLTTE